VTPRNHAARNRVQNSRMDEIFKAGLHEFIGAFVSDLTTTRSAPR
jgi:hypothetical protein